MERRSCLREIGMKGNRCIFLMPDSFRLMPAGEHDKVYPSGHSSNVLFYRQVPVRESKYHLHEPKDNNKRSHRKELRRTGILAIIVVSKKATEVLSLGILRPNPLFPEQGGGFWMTEVETKEKGSFLMSPKVDFCFKELMRNSEVRKGFLSAVLEIPPEEIRVSTIIPTDLQIV